VKHYLGACLMVMDENSYLPEWIEFHRTVGVEHFYIYDNGSRMPVAETLKKDVEKGDVTVIPYPGRRVQVSIYGNCVNTFRNETKWLAIFDVDEFLFPTQYDDLRTLLKEYEGYGGLVVSSLFFGTSGHKVRPEGLQIDNFTKRLKDGDYENTFIKSIVQPDKVKEVTDPHIIRTIEGWPSVNEKGEVVTSWRSDQFVEKVRLNHYFSRSNEEFEEKAMRHLKDEFKDLRGTLERFDSHCVLEDRTITRYSDRLKTRLKERIF